MSCNKLSARLGVARILLERLENKPEKFAIMSRVQRTAVEKLATEPEFVNSDPEEKAKMVERAMEEYNRPTAFCTNYSAAWEASDNIFL